jgi:hypothetical protein
MAVISENLVVPGPRAAGPGLVARVRSAATTGAIALRDISAAAFCASSTTSLDDAGVLRTTVAQAMTQRPATPSGDHAR